MFAGLYFFHIISNFKRWNHYGAFKHINILVSSPKVNYE